MRCSEIRTRFLLAVLFFPIFTLQVFYSAGTLEASHHIDDDVVTKHPAALTRLEKLSGFEFVGSGNTTFQGTDYIYVGDSRVRHMFAAHLRYEDIEETWYDDDRCLNNSFRYSNVDHCANSESDVLLEDENAVRYRACWRTDLECFERLIAKPQEYLKLRNSRRSKLFISIGLHDVVFRVSSEKNFVASLRNLMHSLSEVFEFAEDVTWISLYQLFDPAQNKKPKFSSYKKLNKRLASLAERSNDVASSFSFTVFNVTENLHLSTSSALSPDTVHLYHDVESSLVTEMLNSSQHFHKVLDHLEKAGMNLTGSASTAFSCGERPFILPPRSSHVKVVFFGGSVTSDNKMIQGFKRSSAKHMNWTVSAVNLGEPGTDSTYQAHCWEHTSSGHLRGANFVFVEYCANDNDVNTVSLKRLLEAMLGLPGSPAVFYYCHRGPRSRLQRREIPSAHLELAKSMGVNAVTNHFLLFNSRLCEDGLLFRDSIHLTQRGGDVIGDLLHKAIHKCSRWQNTSSKVIPFVANVTPSVCYSSLGPRGVRNLDPLVSGWKFVEDSHRSAPNGKNGFEPFSRDSKMKVTLPSGCQYLNIKLFYIVSNKSEMGMVNVSISKCPGYTQTISGHGKAPFTMTRAVTLNIPGRCCTSSNQLVIELRPVQRLKNVPNSTRFRVSAVAMH